MRTEGLCAVAHDCPSGAITYERTDGGPQESAPKVNVANIRENGPIAIHADLALEGAGKSLRATLCRCGASKNKPFCDSSHHEIQFVATGEPATQESKSLENRGGELKITPFKDGPLGIAGNLEIISGTGRTVNRVTKTALCRCGHSANKPFCDGTHAKIGFKSE
jgi:CDGSH-type Zn-finger protein